MSSQALQAKSIETLVALNAAVKNIRLYPPASAMVQKSVERVLSFLEVIFQSREDLNVAESEKNLLIFGTPLTEKEQQKPQVTAFIATLLDFGIKTLTFKQGVTLLELETLLQTLSRKAEDIQNEGGLQAVLAHANLRHIVLDEKVHMAVDQDRQAVPETEKRAALDKVLQTQALSENTDLDQVDDREARIDELVTAGDTEAAVKLLFELLVENAKKKNFTKAEALRDRLYDVDAMALTEIVKAGEIIEQEKSESIDQDHLEAWTGLYDKLTSEETNALFHAMEEVSYDIDQTVFAQGQKNDHLYFITAGRLKLVYRDGKREALLKKLEKGDLAGHATFFSISMCTTSLITLSSVTMNALHRDVLEQWEKEFPALQSKIEDYCLKLEKSHDIIKKKGVERRRHDRFGVKGKILVQLLNKNRQPMGKPFKGDFADISEGGLSFYIITSKRETARTLLGRRLGLQFLIPTRAAPLKTFQQGTVICVNYHLKNDYSVHVSFDDELPDGIAGAIRRLKNIKF